MFICVCAIMWLEEFVNSEDYCKQIGFGKGKIGYILGIISVIMYLFPFSHLHAYIGVQEHS